MSKQEVVCLHTDRYGDIWSLQTGSAPEKFTHLASPHRLRTGNYRVIGVPRNFWLITELYSTLSRTQGNSRLYVGNKNLCKSRKANVEDALSCMSVLDVHDNLFNCWHAMDNITYNHYLMLFLSTPSRIDAVAANLYQNHCMRKYFDFLGLNSASTAIRFLDIVQEPRWYLSATRPYRLNKIETLFGLKGRRTKKTKDNFRFIGTIQDKLSSDSFLWNEKKYFKEVNTVERAGRCIVNFLIRNWLKELGCEGYFNPKLFFSNDSDLEDYQRQFGSRDA
jgi:hypothetical protein